MHLFVSVWEWNKQKKRDTNNRKPYQKQSILYLTIVKPRKMKNNFEKYIWIKWNKQREFIWNKTHSWMIIIKRIWIERKAALSNELFVLSMKLEKCALWLWSDLSVCLLFCFISFCLHTVFAFRCFYSK